MEHLDGWTWNLLHFWLAKCGSPFHLEHPRTRPSAIQLLFPPKNSQERRLVPEKVSMLGTTIRTSEQSKEVVLFCQVLPQMSMTIFDGHLNVHDSIFDGLLSSPQLYFWWTPGCPWLYFLMNSSISITLLLRDTSMSMTLILDGHQTRKLEPPPLKNDKDGPLLLQP